jgi:hypothetical protein
MRKTVLSLLLGTAAFLAATLALAATPSAQAATVRFADPVGDAGAAPDVTGVAVWDANGLVTFGMTVTGVKTEVGSSGHTLVATVLDTDRNTATGDENGSEYYFVFGSDAGESFGHAFHYVDGGWTMMAPTPHVTFGSSGDDYTVTFEQEALGVTQGFDFFVLTGAFDGGKVLGYDVAPDSNGPAFGTWSFQPTPAAWEAVGALAGLTTDGSIYIRGEDGLWHNVDAETFAASGYDRNTVSWFGQLPGTLGMPVPHVSLPAPAAPVAPAVPRVAESVAVVTPAIGAPVTKPVKVVAGKTVKVTFPVTDANTGADVLVTTKMVGSPSINGLVIRHVEHFGNGLATITLKVPKAAKGKTLAVGLKIEVADQSASKLVTFHVH